MDLNKLITKRINEYALNGDANFLDQYGFLITMIAKEYAAQQLILSGVVKSLPTKEEINLAANECSDINEIICEDEYWVIAKNDGFQEGADFVINKLK